MATFHVKHPSWERRPGCLRTMRRRIGREGACGRPCTPDVSRETKQQHPSWSCTADRRRVGLWETATVAAEGEEVRRRGATSMSSSWYAGIRDESAPFHVKPPAVHATHHPCRLRGARMTQPDRGLRKTRVGRDHESVLGGGRSGSRAGVEPSMSGTFAATFHVKRTAAPGIGIRGPGPRLQ